MPGTVLTRQHARIDDSDLVRAYLGAGERNCLSFDVGQLGLWASKLSKIDRGEQLSYWLHALILCRQAVPPSGCHSKCKSAGEANLIRGRAPSQERSLAAEKLKLGQE
jgi:hypothetical protein